MTDDDLRAELAAAYARGDHRHARPLARRILTEDHAPALHERARQVLTATEPDLFLPWVGAAGLGLVAWLVYNYML